MSAFVLPTLTTFSSRKGNSSQISPRRVSIFHSSPKCNLSPSYDHQAESDSPDRDLHWKDRVALFAQVSAEETLDVLLHALRENTRSGPRKDDGIDALYVFANLDIWALTHRFFGKKMDLGQFERFKRVIVASPYDVLLRDYRMKTLSALYIVPDSMYVSRRQFEEEGQITVFKFTLKKTEFGGGRDRAWMVDSIIHEDVQ